MVPIAAPAAVLHVSPAGPADGNGSVEKPFRTLERAAAVLSDGDEIRVAAGAYTPSSLPILVERSNVRVAGGYDATFSTRRPFDTPSVLQGPAGFDRALVEIAAGRERVTIDGLTFDGGTGLTYGRSGLTEAAATRMFALLRIRHARDSTVRNCVFVNSPAHAIAASVRDELGVVNNVMVNSRVSALAFWGVQHGARVRIADNTIIGVWAERPGGARGDGIDVQQFLTATIERNVIAGSEGACIRIGRGNETPVLHANVIDTSGNALRGWPDAGQGVVVPLDQWERLSWLDAKSNRPMEGPLPFADANVVVLPGSAAVPPGTATPYAPRFIAPITPLVGAFKDAGAKAP